jgi:hypothetical protein
MRQGLWVGRTPVRSKRAAKMTKQIIRRLRERLKVRSGIRKPRFARLCDDDYA